MGSGIRMIYNSPLPPASSKLTDAQLIEEILLQMRRIAVNGPRPLIDESRQRLKELTDEAGKRSLSFDAELQELSAATGWRMNGEFIASCLDQSLVEPEVQLLNGARRSLLCWNCLREERANNEGELCKSCLTEALDALQHRNGKKWFVFTTVSSAARCPHASSETLQVSMYGHEPGWYGRPYCEQCISDEMQKFEQ